MHGNCILCNTFDKLNRIGMCPTCHSVDEQLLQQAREIAKHQGRLSLFEMADRLGISPMHIYMWIQQGRIRPSVFRYTCPICGRELTQRFCDCMKKTYVENACGGEKYPEKFYSAIRIQQCKDRYWEQDSRIRKKQRKDIWLHK